MSGGDAYAPPSTLPSALQDSPAWPDPAPLYGLALPTVDDISRMNARCVGGLFNCRCEDDVVDVIALARRTGRRVCVRGTQHSMGGHSISEGALVIDTSLLSRVSFDPHTAHVTAETGATWIDVIRVLNVYGRSPRTMQSYASFSVGGTLAVNAHGITTDHPIAESVVSFRIITADGRVVTCSRDAESEQARDLFRCAIGGYGMFGVITQATFKTDGNVNLIVHSLQLASSEFPSVYDSALAADDVVIKLARLDLTNLDNITLFLFRRAGEEGARTVSSLPHMPREMTGLRRLMFKWLAPTFKELRFAIENRLGVALDWNDADEQQRNVLMFESAEPLARLFEPLLRTDDTFILQEYFVPREHFLAWVWQAKPIVASIDSEPHKRCTLLNMTVRFVRQDMDTALPYARHPDGMYAFVLYYRIPRSREGDAALESFHRAFVAITLSLGGTFYLPYRHHYSDADLRAAYPDIETFWAAKAAFDPDCLFDSLWRQRYGPPQMRETPSHALLVRDVRDVCASSSFYTDSDNDGAAAGSNTVATATVSERRTDSFRQLLRHVDSWREFCDRFLVSIFNVEDPLALSRAVAKCIWDPRNSDDSEIYEALQTELARNGSGPLRMLSTGWRQIAQLRDQKAEFLRETLSILGHLGKVGHVHDYVSIGDHGKMADELRRGLGMRGRCVCVHDVMSDDIPAVIEKGTLTPPDDFVRIDYDHVDGGLPNIPSESADLVTINQGLHHLPQGQLAPFLRDVRRILRPGGLFIVREHDWDPERHPRLLPMLDVAHMVFNAVTGVSPRQERRERRAFRSVLEWRTIVESAGLCDSRLYEMQAGDPTWDEMMCFFKPPLWPCESPADIPAHPTAHHAPRALAYAAPIALPRVAAVMNDAPGIVLAGTRAAVAAILSALPSFTVQLKATLASVAPAQAYLLHQPVENMAETVSTLLLRVQAHLASVELREDVPDLIPSEIFLAIHALHRKASAGNASAMELAACALLKSLEGMITLEQPATRHAGAGEGAKLQSPAGDSRACMHTEYGSDGNDESAQGHPTAADVEAVILTLLETIPELNDESVVGSLGLPPLAQRYVHTVLQGTPQGVRAVKIASLLADKLDSHAWASLKNALERIDTFSASARLPTLSNIRTEGNPWRDAAIAILGSAKLPVSQAATWQAWFVGLSDFVTLWRGAQEERVRLRVRCAGETGIAGDADADGDGQQGGAPFRTIAPAALDELRSALDDLDDGRISYVKMQEGRFYDVPDVVEVIEAKYGYRSYTADYADVTEAMQRHYLHDGRLHLKGRNLTSELSGEGLLPWRAIDAVRCTLTGNVRKLKIRYRRTWGKGTGGSGSVRREEIARVCRLLSTAGLTRPLHGGGQEGHWTWFKLSEWMQVEITQALANGMEQTPWYRFPFTRFLALYFGVLWKEVRVVADKFGWQKALASKAFGVDLVPGIAMAGIFMQLQLLALPVLSVGGEAYDDSALVEELVVTSGAPSHDPAIDWNGIYPRIRGATRVVDDLFVVTVPTFKPLTEAVVAIARALPHARLLEISHRKEVQVKLRYLDNANDADADDADSDDELRETPIELEGGAVCDASDPVARRLLMNALGGEWPVGCEHKFSFQFPTFGAAGSLGNYAVLCVQAEHLLETVRIVDAHSDRIEIAQIYDFFN